MPSVNGNGVLRIDDATVRCDDFDRGKATGIIGQFRIDDAFDRESAVGMGIRHHDINTGRAGWRATSKVDFNASVLAVDCYGGHQLDNLSSRNIKSAIANESSTS